MTQPHEVVSKGEFARICGMSPGRVSHWVADGRLHAAVVGQGRSAGIRLSVGLNIIAERRTPARMLPVTEGFSLKKTAQTASSVYVISAQNGPTKIGKSRNAEHRLADLQRNSPFDLKLVHVEHMTAALAHDVERAAHLWLRRHRMRGEWFAVSVDEAKIALRASIDFIETSRLARG